VAEHGLTRGTARTPFLSLGKKEKVFHPQKKERMRQKKVAVIPFPLREPGFKRTETHKVSGAQKPHPQFLVSQPQRSQRKKKKRKIPFFLLNAHIYFLNHT